MSRIPAAQIKNVSKAPTGGELKGFLDWVRKYLVQALESITSLTSALTLKADKRLTDKLVVTTTYTLVLADADLALVFSHNSGCTVTIPPNSAVAFELGTLIPILSIGTVPVTLAAGVGVTLRNPATAVSRVQYSTIGIRKIATDTWVASGDLVV